MQLANGRKAPTQRRRITSTNFTGCSAAWQRACFGSRRSGVQIPASRPAARWTARDPRLTHGCSRRDIAALVRPSARLGKNAPMTDTEAERRAGGSIVLLTLASAQFLMTLDSSVMNVSIATVAKDVGTTVTGIQLAITLYTLVMAAFMITGGKIGQILGRKRAFMIGCVIYGCGLADHRPGRIPARPPHRLVAPRGARGGADHARRRRARGDQLRAVRAAPRLRAGGVGRRHRRRGRPAGRRAAARPTRAGAGSSPARS